MSYHKPVLLEESIEFLAIQPDGIYVDVTFGGGGHSRLILSKLNSKGRLIAFDQDADALSNVPEDERLILIPQNFRYIKRFLKLHHIVKVNGILADLGVSSHQLDKAERGFSYRFEADLDMRMNQAATIKASDILNTYNAGKLQQLFSDYGEVRNAKTLAQGLVQQRSSKRYKTIADLLYVVEPLIRGNRPRYLAQVFQALRIEVNEEMEVLKEFLRDSKDVLDTDGRLVVISYHSLEDRLVKKFFKTGNCEGEVKKDFYGNIERPFNLITKKAFTPSAEECKINSRARSAKMRVVSLK